MAASDIETSSTRIPLGLPHAVHEGHLVIRAERGARHAVLTFYREGEAGGPDRWLGQLTMPRPDAEALLLMLNAGALAFGNVVETATTPGLPAPAYVGEPMHVEMTVTGGPGETSRTSVTVGEIPAGRVRCEACAGSGRVTGDPCAPCDAIGHVEAGG